MPDVKKVFIGGGGDDWISHIVENYFALYTKNNPEVETFYFSWTDQFAATKTVLDFPKSAHITIVGHSYGADAAFSAVSAGRTVDVLVTIDPVGRIRPSWASIRSGARTWLNVRAQPSEKRRSFDDTIAGIGGKYPLPPAPGKASSPNYSLIADATHGDFHAMMRLTGKGVSGASLLGGVRVP